MQKLFNKFFILAILLLVPSLLFADFVQVTLLGTGSPRPDVRRAGPAVLIEAGGKHLLFDAGRTVVQRLEQLDIPITKIHQVFLTHLHSDHISALDDLWLTGWIYQRPQALTVFGPSGTASFVQHLQQAYAYDASLRHQHAGLDPNAAKLMAVEIKPGVIYTDSNVKVTAFLVNHKPVDPAYGYRIDFGERSIVVSGDTTYSKNLIDHSKDIDVLIHEIFAAKESLLEKNPRLQKIEQYHTNPGQLTQILNEVKPRVAVLTHAIILGIDEDSLMKDIEDNYSGEIHLGEDLMVVRVGSKIKVEPFKQVITH